MSQLVITMTNLEVGGILERSFTVSSQTLLMHCKALKGGKSDIRGKTGKFYFIMNILQL